MTSLYWDGPQGSDSIWDVILVVSGIVEMRRSVIRSSGLNDGISYTGKMASLYWNRAQDYYEKSMLKFMLVNKDFLTADSQSEARFKNSYWQT